MCGKLLPVMLAMGGRGIWLEMLGFNIALFFVTQHYLT